MGLPSSDIPNLTIVLVETRFDREWVSSNPLTPAGSAGSVKLPPSVARNPAARGLLGSGGNLYDPQSAKSGLPNGKSLRVFSNIPIFWRNESEIGSIALHGRPFSAILDLAKASNAVLSPHRRRKICFIRDEVRQVPTITEVH